MLTAKGKNITFTLPSAWFEVTLKQYVDLYPKRKTDDEGNIRLDPYDAAKAFVSDITVYHAAPAGEIARMLEQWLPVLGPMPDWSKLELPYLVAGVRPPEEIGTCTQLQIESVKLIVDDMIEEEGAADYILLAIPMLAVLLYPLLTKKPLTDTDQIEAVIPIIEALPVTEALPLAAFFLSSLGILKPSGQMSFVISYPKAQRKGSLMAWFRSWRPTVSRLLFRRSPSKSASLTSKPSSYPTTSL